MYKIVYDGDGGNKKSIESKTLVDEGKQFNNGRKNKLKPNIRYKTGEFDYFYETDNIGRIEKFETDNLKLTERSNRLPHSKNTPGKLRGKDNAGHLAGDRFGGSPKIDNLVSQLENVNKSQYKKIENQWAKALEEGKQVKVKLDIKYEGNSMRPSKFNVHL
ncbi:DNA/RNA non-specific endonuclease [Clostridium felsineum]|uniref:DNA/RNA non-specific endonuclease n=1 Tax=Clostridium felsineum TaxID=36839 RepID=UPI0009D38F7D|nr:DNA/RNA non-specific endonuclease [Clostridium felsineum]URZ14855.1 Type VII secretion systems protein EssD [Clostridium felsineum DSM 794]